MGKPPQHETKPSSRHHRSKYLRQALKPRQEISRVLKYLIFFINFLVVICGMTAIALGIYLYIKDFRPVEEAVDFFLNPAVVLITVGILMCFISIMGCMGSLRENICMLKMFALTLFFCYIMLVVVAFIVFILFYSDTATGISIQSLLLGAVSHYHENDNYRDFMDYLQMQLKCCGATTQGYKDWANSPQFNCSASNPLPEKCGVPYSCCKPTTIPGPGEGNPSLRTTDNFPKPNVQCWRHAQQESLTEVQDRIYTDGCLRPLQNAFEGHAVIIGAVIGAIIIPVCLSVTFSNILAKQIERQRYLLHKEARKEERRKRRNRQKFRDPFARAFTPPRRRRDEHLYTTVDETTDDTLPITASADGLQNGDPKELRATNLTNEMILGTGSRAESNMQQSDLPGEYLEPNTGGDKSRNYRKKSRSEEKRQKRLSREYLTSAAAAQSFDIPPHLAHIPDNQNGSRNERRDKDRSRNEKESRHGRSRLSTASAFDSHHQLPPPGDARRKKPPSGRPSPEERKKSRSNGESKSKNRGRSREDKDKKSSRHPQLHKSATDPSALFASCQSLPRGETMDDISVHPSGSSGSRTRKNSDAMGHRYHSDLSLRP